MSHHQQCTPGSRDQPGALSGEMDNEYRIAKVGEASTRSQTNVAPSPSSCLDRQAHPANKKALANASSVQGVDERSSEVSELIASIETKVDAATEEGSDARAAPSSGATFTNIPSHTSTPDHQLYEHMRIPPCMLREDPLLGDQLSESASSPPVTIATLQELDLVSIQNNLNLRIDICYDQDLYFQPISGRKGDTKRDKARGYWLSLMAELKIHWHNAHLDCPECRHTTTLVTAVYFKPRLPLMFSNLKEIVEMLVPDSEHEEVANHLDIDLLMQQVRNGALDTARLATWLTCLLTSHCAPMRDEFAEEIVRQICDGCAQADLQLLVDGLEQLFSFLEAMKLDVANHQIRAFRYPLIEDTIPFQQDCFARAIETKQMSITSSKQWYLQSRIEHERHCAADDRRSGSPVFPAFIHGLVSLSNPYQTKLPTTFQYDRNRFARLRDDLQDRIQIDLCFSVLDQRTIEVLGSYRSSLSLRKDLANRITSLAVDENGRGGAISDHLDAIGVELTRVIFEAGDQSQCQARTRQDHETARTILLLRKVFQHEDEYQTHTKKSVSSLECSTLQFATQFLPLSALGVSNAQRQWTTYHAKRQVAEKSSLAGWDDIARRLAHIGVLHWKVWAELCYLEAKETRCDLASPRRSCDADQAILPYTGVLCAASHKIP